MTKQKKALLCMKENGYTFKKGKLIGPKGKILALSLKDGYYFVKIKISIGNYTNIPYHRVIAFKKFGHTMFGAGVCVRHLDGNSKNNKLGNLALGNQHDNSMDQPANVRKRRASRASEKVHVFPDNVIDDIWNMRKEGATYKMITEKYGYAKSTLSWFFNKSEYVRKRIYGGC